MSRQDLRNARRIRTSVRALVRRFAISERADIACCGMTVAQAATLEALSCCGPLRLSELSSCLGIAPSTLTRNLRRLEASGAVEKIADPADARAVRARLTEAGKTAAAEVEKQEEAFSLDVLNRLPAERREAVAECLELLLEAVREASRECCAGAFEHLMEGPAGLAAPARGGATRSLDCEQVSCEIRTEPVREGVGE